MTIFQDKLLTRTDCDEAGDCVVPNVLSPRDQVFRPNIGHKLYHHHRRSKKLSAQTKLFIRKKMFKMFIAAKTHQQ